MKIAITLENVSISIYDNWITVYFPNDEEIGLTLTNFYIELEALKFQEAKNKILFDEDHDEHHQIFNKISGFSKDIEHDHIMYDVDATIAHLEVVLMALNKLNKISSEEIVTFWQEFKNTKKSIDLDKCSEATPESTDIQVFDIRNKFNNKNTFFQPSSPLKKAEGVIPEDSHTTSFTNK